MVEHGIINGPDYDQTEIMIRLLPTLVALGCNLVKILLYIEIGQLHRLSAEPAIDPRSTFCISERCIAGLHNAKLLAELTTIYTHTICSKPPLS